MSAIAKLRKLHTSPRKTGLVTDLIKGMNAEKALQTLQHTHKGSAQPIAKLLQSAIANYQSKEGQSNVTPAQLYIKEIHVGSAGMLKRIKPAPRGTAHRIRKRMAHITLIVDKHIPKPKTKKTPKKTTKAKPKKTTITPKS